MYKLLDLNCVSLRVGESTKRWSLYQFIIYHYKMNHKINIEMVKKIIICGLKLAEIANKVNNEGMEIPDREEDYDMWAGQISAIND